jgi:hypothetical protein
MEITVKRPQACNPQTILSGTEDWIGKLDKIIINSIFSLLSPKLAPLVGGMWILPEFHIWAKVIL